MPMYRVVYSTVIEVVEEFYATSPSAARTEAENRIAMDEVGDIEGLNYGVDSITPL